MASPRVDTPSQSPTLNAVTLTHIAQFIAVCSPEILAETLGYAVSFSSPWRGKRRVLGWRKPVLMDQLQPSTNTDKLSEDVLRPCAIQRPHRKSHIEHL